MLTKQLNKQSHKCQHYISSFDISNLWKGAKGGQNICPKNKLIRGLRSCSKFGKLQQQTWQVIRASKAEHFGTNWVPVARKLTELW